MLPLTQIQAALYQALTAALAPVPVLDAAGPNQPYPFCTLGEMTGTESDTLTEQGVDVEFICHVWSRQPGMKECQTLMETAKDALHHKRFAAAACQWVDTIWDFSQTLRDPDGVTRHGIVRFRILTFQERAVIA